MDYKSKIDHIFFNNSIYKSIIIIHDCEKKSELFEALTADDYPVSCINDMISFKIDKTRILLADYIDFKNIDHILLKSDLEKIDTIIFINPEFRMIESFDKTNRKTYIIR